MRYMSPSGVLPSDPLADLIFNECTVVFLKDLTKLLAAHDLMDKIPKIADNPRWKDRPIHDDCSDLDRPTWVMTTACVLRRGTQNKVYPT